MSRFYLCIFLLLTTNASFAESFNDDGGWYLGGKLGATVLDIEAANQTSDPDPSTASMGVVAGYNFNDFLSVESDLSSFGKFKQGAEPEKLVAFSTYLLGRYHVSDRAALYAKVGNSIIGNDLNLSGGIGLKYQISQQLELDTGYRLIGDVPNTEDDLYEFSVGINYKFGKNKPAPKVVPPAEPVIVPTTLNSNTLFKFNSAEISDSSALAKLAKKMSASHVEINVEIVAYTDTSGPEAYNLKLSKKRAEAVRDYFIKQGVNKQVINTAWKGEANPIASNKTRAGRIKNRRVDIIYIENNVVYH
ncbi:outer membrane protein OmpA [Moritella sp. PE36]|uniref:OmpA family protein n=1 Tax=Moritella sp. PE36 TaxID=58051 RepID=UPI0001568CA6|nr:OmpA family protein [Moritella sp. PE36]EDM65379.1 outer membrane protein OmpA [Moritella sp. PE36]